MPDERDQIIEELRKEVEELKRIIEMQNEIIRELREQLRKDSSNSSKPPSSDGLKKSPSIRKEVCGRKAGRNRAGRTVIPAHILLFFQSRTMSLIIFMQTVSTARSVNCA